jgi:hypothetical protein
MVGAAVGEVGLGEQGGPAKRGACGLRFEMGARAVQANDPDREVVPALKVTQEIAAANQRMVRENRQTGDRDVYMNPVGYFPFGRLIVSALTALWGTRWRRNEIYQLLFAIRPRVVADLNSSVYDFQAVDRSIAGARDQTIKTLAEIDGSRYPSETFEA